MRKTKDNSSIGDLKPHPPKRKRKEKRKKKENEKERKIGDITPPETGRKNEKLAREIKKES